MLGLCCCTGFSLVGVSGGLSLVAALLIAVASLTSEHRLSACGLKSCGSQALEHRVSSCGMGLVVLRHVASSHIRDRACASCIGTQILNHRATREFLKKDDF